MSSKSKDQIKKLRKTAGLTQVQMAEKLAVSKSYVSQLERGICDISLSKFLEYCKLLEVDTKEII